MTTSPSKCPCCGADTSLTQEEISALEFVLGKKWLTQTRWLAGKFQINRADFGDARSLWPAAQNLVKRGYLRRYRFATFEEELEATSAGAAALGLPTFSDRLKDPPEKKQKKPR